MKRMLMSALAVLSVAGTASAAPIALPGDTGLFIKFNNIELVDLSGANSLTAPVGTTYAPFVSEGTMGNWGLVVISSIQYATIDTPHDLLGADDSKANIFTNSPGTAQITGVFYGIDLTSPNTATGGRLDLFWQDGTALSTGGSSPTGATVNAFTSGTFLASIALTPGIMKENDSTSTDCSTTVFTAAGVNAGSGFADSYGNVDTTRPGTYTDSLNGNYFTNPCGGTSDVRFKNSFNRITNIASPWFGNGANVVGLSSQDPAQAFTSPVPEPATLTLFGLGLIGAAARRRKKAA